MIPNKHESSRKNFLLILSVVIFCLTLVSLVASYSVYIESFADWGSWGKVFALLVTVGVEVAFAVLIYGLSKALIGGEVVVAGIGAVGLLAVMAVNFVIHSNQVRHVPLSAWQQSWLDWIGPVIPFATIALFILISWLSPESKERRQERRMAFLGKQRALDHKEAYLQSPELEAELENLGPLIAEEVRQHVTKGLPAPKGAYAQSNRQPIGFAPKFDDFPPETRDSIQSRYFPKK